MTMQTNILWTGREYYSLENCLVNTTDSGSEIFSTIIGLYEDELYKVEYHIRTNADWETVFAEINSRHSNQTQFMRLEGDGKGNWLRNGQEAAHYNGCIDIDIPLTPFTNTLPINRLQLTQGLEREINVIYIDLLAQQTTAVRQKYKRLSKTMYHYENVPNDFEANIEVDEFGLVVDYPQLFVRKTALETSYQL